MEILHHYEIQTAQGDTYYLSFKACRENDETYIIVRDSYTKEYIASIFKYKRSPMQTLVDFQIGCEYFIESQFKSCLTSYKRIKTLPKQWYVNPPLPNKIRITIF